MNTERPPAARTLKTAAVAVIVLLHLVALFDAEGLKTWAERLSDRTAQSILLPPIEAWYGFSRAVGATAARSFIRDSLFAPVREAAWPAGTFETAAAPSPQASAPPAAAPSPAPAVSPSPPSPAASRPPSAAAPSTAPSEPVVVSPERPLDVLVLGDSIAATALPPMLNLAFARNKSIRIVFETHSASSIAKPVFFDWPAALRRITAARQKERGRPFDLAVVVLGSNDAQTLRVGGRFCDFGSECWNEAFRARAEEFMTILASGCGRMYWCGVPPMRRDGYRDRMVALNGLYREIASAFPAARWVPLDFLGDEHGRYAQTKAIGKAEREIRDSDGVHLSYAGAGLVVDRLIELINEDFRFAVPGDKPIPSNAGS